MLNLINKIPLAAALLRGTILLSFLRPLRMDREPFFIRKDSG